MTLVYVTPGWVVDGWWMGGEWVAFGISGTLAHHSYLYKYMGIIQDILYHCSNISHKQITYTLIVITGRIRQNV